jgi:hypothetical protein
MHEVAAALQAGAVITAWFRAATCGAYSVFSGFSVVSGSSAATSRFKYCTLLRHHPSAELAELLHHAVAARTGQHLYTAALCLPKCQSVLQH